MMDIKIIDMDIISWYNFRLLNTFKYKKIEKLSDIINCTKLMVRSSDTSDTEKVYQGFRDLVLYRYCNIPCDNNIVLDSSIIFDNKGIPIAIMNDDRPIHYILYRLGLGYWDAGTVCSYINRNGYNNLKDVNLRTVFNDILSNKFSFEKDSNKIGLMLKRRIHLILESSDKFKENISNNSYGKR